MGPLRPPLNPFFPPAKSEVLRREQQKRTQNFKMEELPGLLIIDQQNFSVETKQEPDYVSTTTNFFPAFTAYWRNVFLLFLYVLVFFSPCG